MVGEAYIEEGGAVAQATGDRPLRPNWRKRPALSGETVLLYSTLELRNRLLKVAEFSSHSSRLLLYYSIPGQLLLLSF